MHSSFKHCSLGAGLTLRHISSQNGFAYPRVLTDWDKIVGHDIAGMCSPVRIRFGKGYNVGATLVIYANGAIAQEIEYRKVQIIDKINTYYGYQAIHKISLTQTANHATSKQLRTQKARHPLTIEEKSEIDTVLENIENKSLKTALYILATYRCATQKLK